jgi:predicted kinase
LLAKVSQRIGACYLRVDAAETALARIGAAVGVAGYAVIHELAVSNLLLGNTVVVDAVNSVPEARMSWREVAGRAQARLVSAETVVPDEEEHRRRVECRVADIPGHEVPT